jgi:predicted GNAT superfamily acetyltransferase
VEARELRTIDEIRAGVALYRRVLQLTGEDASVGPRLLAALRNNGGVVLGAFVDGMIVGFAYGFLARDSDDRLYHYSQAAVVDTDWQGRGVGRALKRAQRALVVAGGVTTMRWAFDPLRTGNAHFNLDVLGAVGRWFERDLYGVEPGGRDAGRRSDRLIVEWDLRKPDGSVRRFSPPYATGLPSRWGDVARTQGVVSLAVPFFRSEIVVTASTEFSQLQDDVAAAFERLLRDGYCACSCQAVDDRTAIYSFRRLT